MKPAEVFPLCEYLRDELLARGWSQNDLARGTWLASDRVGEILDGARVSLAEAEALAARLGVSAALLLNLQMAWLRGQSGPAARDEDHP